MKSICRFQWNGKMETKKEPSYVTLLSSPLPAPFKLRRLEQNDYEKGFIRLLGELSVVDDVSHDLFLQRFIDLSNLGPFHYIVVVENEQTSTIVATATLMIEPKFLHKCSNVGHIEDVVVTESVRGQHLGQRVVASCINYALEHDCYKVILDCKADRVGFYGKLGFEVKEQQMALYFHKP
jgi:glucosamine-phosphate N-acetyltransferase